MAIIQLERTSPNLRPTPLGGHLSRHIGAGFEPYYECREEDRFIATFQRRQGYPIRLAEVPDGSRMLGLSYPGGLSRQTTAMLCLVDELPVMVFAARFSSDRPQPETAESANIHVHRTAYHGLVLYEITPFPDIRMSKYLVSAAE